MAITVAKTVYIDTNEFVYARASETFPPEHHDLHYYKKGTDCIDALKTCREHGIVVYSSMISRIELLALNLDWIKRKRLVELSMPLAFAFGEAHRDSDDQLFIDGLFSLPERKMVYEDLGNWFKSWNFANLIRWAMPGDIPHWCELTEVALRYVPRMHLADALHVGAAIGLECTKFFTSDNVLIGILGKIRQDTKLRRELVENKWISRGYKLPDPARSAAGVSS